MDQTNAQQLATLALKVYVDEIRIENPNLTPDKLVALAIARMLLLTNNINGYTVGKELQRYH